MKTRFIDEQIIQMLKEPEAREKTADVFRRYGISQALLQKGGLRRSCPFPADVLCGSKQTHLCTSMPPRGGHIIKAHMNHKSGL